MRFSNKQSRINIPFNQEGAKYYAATLSVIIANIAFNSAWANKIMGQVEFNSTTTTLMPQNPTTITPEEINSPPQLIIDVLAKDLIHNLEKNFNDDNNIDFKPVHTDETVIGQLSNQDEAIHENEIVQDDTYENDENIKEEIYAMLLDDDDSDMLINQINAYDEKIKAISIAREINTKENPKVDIEEESSSTSLILAITGLLGAGGAGLAFAGGGSNATPPSPPPNFTLTDKIINEGGTIQVAVPEKDQYGDLNYIVTYDTDNVNIVIAEDEMMIEGLDDSVADVVVTATNVHALTTTENFLLTVNNVNPKIDEITDQVMPSGGVLLINLLANDVKNDGIIFTASTSEADLINLSIIDLDTSDHKAELKITELDILPLANFEADVKVIANDDDGGINTENFNVAINNAIQQNIVAKAAVIDEDNAISATTDDTVATNTKTADNDNKTTDTTDAKTQDTEALKDTSNTDVATKNSATLADIVTTEVDIKEESSKAQTDKQPNIITDSRSDTTDKQTTADLDSDDVDTV